MESSKEPDIQVEPSENSGLEIKISKSSALMVFEAVEDEVTGCVGRREKSRTELSEHRQPWKRACIRNGGIVREQGETRRLGSWRPWKEL